MIAESGQVNDYARGIRKALASIDTGIKIDRRKQDAASVDRVIPIAVDEYVSAGSPDVMGRYPIPALLADCPKSRSPNVTALLPNPRSGKPIVIGRWLSNVRPGLSRCRGFGQIVHIAVAGISPVAGGPLIALLNRRPITGDPFAPRR